MSERQGADVRVLLTLLVILGVVVAGESIALWMCLL